MVMKIVGFGEQVREESNTRKIYKKKKKIYDIKLDCKDNVAGNAY